MWGQTRAGQANGHDVSVQHHERQSPIAFPGMLLVEADDRLLLPRRELEITGNPSVVVRLDGPGGSCPGRPQPRSRRTLFANGRTPLAAAPVHHTDRKPALYPTSAASGWQPSLLRCSAFALFSCVLSAILMEEGPLQFHLRQDNLIWPPTPGNRLDSHQPALLVVVTVTTVSRHSHFLSYLYYI